MNSQELASYNVALKNALLEARDAKGRPLTQRIAAKRARIEETRFSRIMRGRVEPTDKERKRVASVLHRPESALFPAVSL